MIASTPRATIISAMVDGSGTVPVATVAAEILGMVAIAVSDWVAIPVVV